MDLINLPLKVYQILYNNKFTIFFYIAIILLIYLNRSKFDFQAKIIALYRTKIGLKAMDFMASRFRNPIKVISFIGMIIGFIGIGLSVILVGLSTALIFDAPPIDGSPIVLPGVAIAGMGGIVFPLIIGILTLLIVIIVHEFSHGVVARAYNIKVKSSGIVFFGPIIGAFVEPDEKKINKKNILASNSVLAAGPFSNFILTAIVLAISFYLLIPSMAGMTVQTGVLLHPIPDQPASFAGINENTLITQMNGIKILNVTQFLEEFENITPNQTIIMGNQNQSFNITTTNHPENQSKGYIGVTIEQQLEPKSKTKFSIIKYKIFMWLQELLFWTWFISLNIGIINLFPIFITDGARMLLLSLERLIKKEKLAKKIWILINYACLSMLLLIIFIPTFKLFLP